FSYNRDLSEDKRAAFDAVDSLTLVLPAMTGLVRTLKVHVDVLRREAARGFTLATEVADWLARQGLPFAEAHEITGALVRRCEDRGIELSEATSDDFAAVDARLGPGLHERLTLEAAVEARVGHGGTAPARVAEQIERLRTKLDAQRQWAAAYGGPA